MARGAFQTTMRALYVDDLALDASSLHQALGKVVPAIELDVVASTAQALTRLREQPQAYQCVLFNLNSHAGDDLQVLRHIRDQPWPVATLAVTSPGDDAAVMQALKAGADDYVIAQGHDLDRLPSLLQDVTRRRQARADEQNQALRVLYAERHIHDGEHVARQLATNAPNLVLDIAQDTAQALAALRADPTHDVLLLAYRLIDQDDLELIRQVRHNLQSDIPIVLVTGMESAELAAQALKWGISDYLIKDNHYLQRLPGIIEFAHAKASLRRERTRLREHRAELLTLTQQVPGVITVTHYPPGSTRGTTPFASDAINDIFEYTHDQVRDDSALFAQRVHVDDRDRLNQDLHRSLTQLVATTCDYRLVLPRQGERWVESQVTPKKMPDGSVRLYSYTFDISTRKASEEKLQASESDLRKVTERVPGVIVVTHHPKQGHATTRFASSALHDIFELHFDDVRDDPRHFARYVHPDDLEALSNIYKQIRQGLTQTVHQYRVVLPIKGLRWLEWQTSIENQPDGSVLLYGYTFDITEHKHYADALNAAELSERANRAKTEFLSRMSHELRTPLNAVIGFSQILRMDQQPGLSARQLSHVGMIEQAGTHLLGMITDVLDLSRIEAGSLPLNPEPTNVRRVCQDALNLVTDLAGKFNVYVALSPVIGDPFVMADQLRLRQVLVNLLSNGIKYNKSGGQVTLNLERQGDQIALHVVDTGIGLTPQQQAHLFEPFNRLGAEGTGVEGTGIGLVIVNKLVEVMHGQLKVNSTVGVGTCFTVTLPLAATPNEATPPLPSRSPRRLAQKRFSILYAEDNEINIELVKQTLRHFQGCDLRVARNGAETMELAQRHPPDIILMDMHLGDMDGVEVARFLQSQDGLKATRYIALSADALPDQIRKAREQGFSAYLTKPFYIADLLACIDENLPD